MKLFVTAALLFSIILTTSCDKDKDDNRDDFHGTWVNQNTPGDTIIFLRKNGVNVASVNQSFNPVLPSRLEYTYEYENNVLKFNQPLWSSAMSHEIKTFVWIERRKQFKFLGHELYPFMASTLAEHVYNRVK